MISIKIKNMKMINRKNTVIMIINHIINKMHFKMEIISFKKVSFKINKSNHKANIK